MTANIERQRACFYIHKKQKKLPKTFIYKKPETFQKARQFLLRHINKNPYTLRYAIFHEIFEVGIYIQKAWHFALLDVYIYKKLDTSQKARQFAIRFYIQNPALCVTRFFIEFLKFAERGDIYW